MVVRQYRNPDSQCSGIIGELTRLNRSTGTEQMLGSRRSGPAGLPSPPRTAGFRRINFASWPFAIAQHRQARGPPSPREPTSVTETRGLGGPRSFACSYTYDSASRLATVAAGTETVAYSYLANSPLVANIWFTNNSTLRMSTTKNHDFLNRLTGTFHVAGGSNVAVFNYANNAANQRTAITNVDNSRWVYQYDALGQVVSGKKYWADGMPVAGQQFEYGFDDIGNRKVTAAGGDAVGANLRYASYTANLLNQYEDRDVPGFVNVIGTAANLATVTLVGRQRRVQPHVAQGRLFPGRTGRDQYGESGLVDHYESGRAQ
jgi:YD repeat-containing protein